MKVEVKPFGTFQEQQYDEILITNQQGVQIGFSNLGARINRWGIQTNSGEYEQIILGHNTASDVFESGSYYGSTVGRVAGRIEKGQFSIDGENYQLPLNNGANHLHGGPNSIDEQLFDYTIEEFADEVRIVFTLVVPDGKNGYPGELRLTVIHSFNEQNEWRVTYEATTDKATLFNPTNHVYFNLNGDNKKPATNHTLKVNSSRYLPLKEDTTPVGPIASVEGTVFDLRQPQLLADCIESAEPQFVFTKGFDHPFVLDKTDSVHAEIYCADTKRRIVMTTDEVAVVIYTHGYLVAIDEIWGHPLEQFAGITLETQNVPGATTYGYFGDTILRPEEVYRSSTMYRLELEV
ncbi:MULTISPECIES: aldose epimerase family protein [unclassified Facklamia]|uniref:aldose epimerase family protein n=1 Tax=Aerococcaceae TaxID=186827 RepID=UPI0013BCDE51|nr:MULTISPECIES: aldose epimerase family protein [unclassified Facklamia]MBS4461610.1 galactose mutarotase [Aerococcaceae bacterium zg-B36]NEW63902.1 galactose-1-epimerase [Facklamia sp. 252]NEW67373.1 galactose-1-epimerase [Facklamia sp. 253]QQD65249.1 galactose mutarotase [Aerococcaceae bacterium zg-252]